MKARTPFQKLIKQDIEHFIAGHKGFKLKLRKFYKTGEADNNFDHDYQHYVKVENIYRSLLDYILTSIERRYEEQADQVIPGAEYVSQFELKVADLLSPMVKALFKPEHRDTVLHHLLKSVVILHRDNVHCEIRQMGFLGEAVDILAVYVNSFCTGDFKKPVPFLEDVIGKNTGLKCFVSYRYFDDFTGIDDYIVHECAHFFHNIKYKYIGIERKNDEERLVEIAFHNRELFAYSIEFYTKIKYLIGQGHDKNQLLSLLDDISINEDSERAKSLVKQALKKRNGWKWMLKECRRFIEI